MLANRRTGKHFGGKRDGDTIFYGDIIAQIDPPSHRVRGPHAVSIRMMHFTPFDASEFLDSEDAVAEYLAAALSDPNPDLFVAALGDVAKARGMTQIAHEAGLGRESLYKSLTPGSKLRYETIRKVMNVLGVKLTVTPQA